MHVQHRIIYFCIISTMDRHKVQLHLYADDTQLYASCLPDDVDCGHPADMPVTLLGWRSSVVCLSPFSTQCRQDKSYLVRFTCEHKETAWPRVVCTSWTREGHPSKSHSGSRCPAWRRALSEGACRQSVIGVLLPPVSATPDMPSHQSRSRHSWCLHLSCRS